MRHWLHGFSPAFPLPRHRFILIRKSRVSASCLKQVLPNLFGKSQDTSTDCSSVPSILSFSSGLRYHLDKVPKPAFSRDLATLWVTAGDPIRCQLELRRGFGTSILAYNYNALFFKALVSILQSLFVDRLKVRQIALVI